jgi:hypothetical protein
VGKIWPWKNHVHASSYSSAHHSSALHHVTVASTWPSAAREFSYRNLAQFGAIYLGGFPFQFCRDLLNLTWKSTTCDGLQRLDAKTRKRRQNKNEDRIQSSEFNRQTLKLSKNRARERLAYFRMALLNGNASAYRAWAFQFIDDSQGKDGTA